jgi:hypothetical protein
MHALNIVGKLATFISTVLFGFTLNAQTAPVLNLSSPVAVGSSPSMAAGMGVSATVFNGRIYLAFQSNDNSSLWISSSSDGATFTDPGTPYTSILMSYAPPSQRLTVNYMLHTPLRVEESM